MTEIQQGATGPAGPRGAAGYNGSAGSRGAAGSAGTQGAAGSAGTQGATGTSYLTLNNTTLYPANTQQDLQLGLSEPTSSYKLEVYDSTATSINTSITPTLYNPYNSTTGITNYTYYNFIVPETYSFLYTGPEQTMYYLLVGGGGNGTVGGSSSTVSEGGGGGAGGSYVNSSLVINAGATITIIVGGSSTNSSIAYTPSTGTTSFFEAIAGADASGPNGGIDVSGGSGGNGGQTVAATSGDASKIITFLGDSLTNSLHLFSFKTPILYKIDLIII